MTQSHTINHEERERIAQALAKARALVRKHFNGRSIVDELIAERREEAKRE